MLPGYRYIIFRTVGPLPLRLATFFDTQARIHTGFQRFPEIGQENKKIIIKIFLIIIKLSKLNQKPLKANFRESKSKQITGGEGESMPSGSPRSFLPRPSFRKSVSIYPRFPNLLVRLFTS